MSLLYAVALLTAAAILVRLLYVVGRRPRVPAWASDAMVANFWLAIFVGLVAFGASYATEAALTWPDQAVGAAHAAIAVAVVAAGALAWRALGLLGERHTAAPVPAGNTSAPPPEAACPPAAAVPELDDAPGRAGNGGVPPRKAA